MSSEVPLSGGWVRSGVVRVGDTVRRPPAANARFVDRLLTHFECIGFEAAPRFLGLDEQGRTVLSFIAGTTFSNCRSILWSDAELCASARLLRRFHDATFATELAGEAEVVCHNDFGPWNLIWEAGEPVAVIDFDEAAPGHRLDDVGYAVWKFLNLGALQLPAVEQSRRLVAFALAYGELAVANVVDAVLLAQSRMAAKVGHAPAAVRRVEKERSWIETNAAALVGE